jgi:HK97 family phage prohead protease
MNELKNFRFDVKITKASDNPSKDFYVEGYASTSDLDRQGDIICREALEKAAKALEEVNDTVFYGHEYDLKNAVGKIVKAEADTIGLKVKIYVSEWAKELRMKLKEGIINKFSIGGRVSKDRQLSISEAISAGLIEEDVPFDEINIIEDIELFEVSFVGVPANPKAGVIRTLSKAIHSALKGGVDMAEVKEDVIKTSEEAEVI